MSNAKGASCQGCGTLLQSSHMDRQGYVPAHILARDNAARCRRCYRMQHYGAERAGRETQHITVRESVGTAALTVQQAIATADAVLMVVELWDFEGSFLPDVIRDATGPIFVAVNKVDLLP